MAQQTILSLFRRMDRGQLAADLQTGVNTIVEHIETNHGDGSGEITLKLKIKCDAPGSYEITPELTVKIPKPKRSKTRAFFNEDTGTLDDRDPRQPDFGVVVAADRSNGLTHLHQAEGDD